MPRPIVRLARQTMTTAYDFSFAKLDEPGEVKLADYAGKAILVVNVASACGFTSQYRDLEALYEAKVGKGLVIIGVPFPGLPAGVCGFFCSPGKVRHLLTLVPQLLTISHTIPPG